MKDGRLLEMQVFKSVADCGGFTAAARVLGASQPFLSRTISSLEKRLGVALLRRSTRRISLTDEGQAFLTSCNRILVDIAAAEELISSESAAIAGELRITAGTSFGLDQIVPILPNFMDAHPNVRLFLSLSDTQSDIIAEGLDVAIRMGKLSDSMLLSRRLCHLQRLVVASPSYISKYGKPDHPTDLLQHNCMMWQAPLDHLNCWPFEVEGRLINLKIRGSFLHSHGSAGAQMCMAGVAIARVAEHLALPAIRSGNLIQLLQDYQVRDDTVVYAIYPKHRQGHPRIRTFVSFLTQTFRTPPWDNPSDER